MEARLEPMEGERCCLVCARESACQEAEGVLAFGVLITLQFAIVWLAGRSAAVRRLVKAESTLLLHRGRLLKDVIATERVTEEEIRPAVRAQGIGILEDVAAVVLETDGSFTILRQVGHGSASTLDGVANRP
jgi:uncharacterized membrane protein YcaP (DUF421 family)